MTTLQNKAVRPDPIRVRSVILAGFVLMFGLGSFVHVGLAITNPTTYRPFADAALFGWVREGWEDIFMSDPRLCALLLGAGELLVAVLLIIARRLGYTAVILFHLALMLFGWGFWLWCIPALAFAVPAALFEFRTVNRRVTP
ncbi:hypothetical protein [Kribbella monticola]|uniref:hypothetical protein n=1 Tax=Kribbella monticola TaxID=2185285 RepID=UPI001300341A|nr:hypothetical protein [Kribbella monticola]